MIMDMIPGYDIGYDSCRLQKFSIENFVFLCNGRSVVHKDANFFANFAAC